MNKHFDLKLDQEVVSQPKKGDTMLLKTGQLIRLEKSENVNGLLIIKKITMLEQNTNAL